MRKKSSACYNDAEDFVFNTGWLSGLFPLFSFSNFAAAQESVRRGG